jgi:hypothetical protein
MAANLSEQEADAVLSKPLDRVDYITLQSSCYDDCIWKSIDWETGGGSINRRKIQ